MSTSSKKLQAALADAIKTINPTAPPEVIAEGLRKIAEVNTLPDTEVAELIRGYFDHFELDVHGPPVIAILRSGYQIRAEGDPEKVLSHLKNAIVGESTARFASTGKGDWNNLWEEIAAEVNHVSDSTHEQAARTLLTMLLADAARAQWGKLINEMFPFLEIDSVPATDIPSFLKLAKKKLVLLLGQDTGDGLPSLRAVHKAVEAHGYQCQLIKELPEHNEMGLIGKVLFAALSARFVVIENSRPSGHLYELPFVRMAECVIVLLQREGSGATWMTEDMIPKHPLLKKFTYKDDTLETVVKDAVLWAEERIAANVKANTGSWPWAKP